ncbi:hypothetical protein L873DRAFT_1833973 [Choiromyces venosus 120613-1]|uniref:DDE Tnp4 domain-containing protein n=1 Tax=Choiromyces venosus 120613-1 TaxID=1336337 RepID=A0A3N4JWY8_9PEZI|nr:hypothetical protein L873DRAFT_1833973 [Choiromyces venosus 120613-1]
MGIGHIQRNGQRLKDLLKIFGTSQARLSTIFNDIVLWLLQRYGKKLKWDENHLSRTKLIEYAPAFKDTTGLSEVGIWGFVDGMMRPFCHLGYDQQSFYSGFKKAHGTKFQSIMTCDGLLSSLAGPFPAPVGDWILWERSGVADQLGKIMGLGDEALYVYGDTAYSPAFGIMGPFRGDSMIPAEEAVNVVMSGHRIVVEWGFAHIVNYWSFAVFKHGLKLHLSPVAAYYMIAVLLTNCHTCLSGLPTTWISELPGLLAIGALPVPESGSDAKASSKVRLLESVDIILW